MKFPKPSPSVFTYCKQSKTGGVEGLGTRLIPNHIDQYFNVPKDATLRWGLIMQTTYRTHIRSFTMQWHSFILESTNRVYLHDSLCGDFIHCTQTLLPTGTTTPFKKGVYEKMLLLMQYSHSQIYKKLTNGSSPSPIIPWFSSNVFTVTSISGSRARSLVLNSIVTYSTMHNRWA